MINTNNLLLVIMTYSSDTLTKALLAEAVHARLDKKGNYPKSQIIKVVESIFDKVQRALILGEDVKISSFGTFTVRYKNPRVGRNPKTGVEARIAARRVVSFRASTSLKSRINRRDTVS